MYYKGILIEKKNLISRIYIYTYIPNCDSPAPISRFYIYEIHYVKLSTRARSVQIGATTAQNVYID